MAKKKEPSFWSTSANGKTASGGSWGVGNSKKKAKSGCPMVAAPAVGVVVALLIWGRR